MADQEKDSAFKVTDKRLFTTAGDPRPDNEAAKSEPPTAEAPSDAEASSGGNEESSRHDFQMTFETLILSLSSTAMVQLGIIPDPTTNQPAKHLPGAKQTIDILEILQHKTKGNLEASESKLLENILYELRMMFLEVSQSIKVPK